MNGKSGGGNNDDISVFTRVVLQLGATHHWAVTNNSCKRFSRQVLKLENSSFID